jgi:hypothetical protein
MRRGGARSLIRPVSGQTGPWSDPVAPMQTTPDSHEAFSRKNSSPDQLLGMLQVGHAQAGYFGAGPAALWDRVGPRLHPGLPGEMPRSHCSVHPTRRRWCAMPPLLQCIEPGHPLPLTGRSQYQAAWSAGSATGIPHLGQASFVPGPWGISRGAPGAGRAGYPNGAGYIRPP